MGANDVVVTYGKEEKFERSDCYSRRCITRSVWAAAFVDKASAKVGALGWEKAQEELGPPAVYVTIATTLTKGYGTKSLQYHCA